MGRKLDALLGRNFKVSKFKTITKLAISRISILSNQHQTRLSHARSDVKELLQLNHQERALLRIERVTMEQNMLDALSMVELYCHLLLDRIKLMGKRKGEPCPEELKEAVSSLIYAASRCGEFPELHKIREALTSKYGKDFAARAVELRNNCEVNPKMVQKFSTRKPSFETRMKVLKEIASECGVTLDLEDDSVNDHKREKLNMKEQEQEQEQEQELTKASANLDDTTQKLHDTVLSEETKQAVHFSESMKTRRKYRDVADAAQEAFQSAAYAANAARAAVELSMSLSIDKGFEDRHGSDNQGGNASDFGISSTTKTDMINTSAASGESEDLDNRQSSEKIEIVETVEELGSESESESEPESEPESESEGEDNSNLGDVAGKEKKPIQRKPSSSNSNTDKRERGTCLDQHDLDSFSVPKSPMNKHYRTFNATTDDHLSHEDSIKPSSKSTP